MSALPLYHSRDMEKSPNQMPLMLDLRELAADRDKKRDIAAVTLNMAISAARRGAIVPQDRWWDEFYAVMRGLTASAPYGDLVG